MRRILALVSLLLAAATTSSTVALDWPQCQLSLPIEEVAPVDNLENLFGLSMVVSGDLLAVGAPLDDEAAVNGGAVYLLRSINGTWTHEAKVFAGDASLANQIGNTVAVSGDVMVSGISTWAPSNFGKAYVFRRINGNWVQEQKLTAPDETGGEDFGRVAAVDGDWIIIGARGDNEQGLASGSAYMWHFEDGVWVMRQKLLAPAGETTDVFGSTVAIQGNTAIVTSRRNDLGPLRWFYFIYEYDGTAWQLVQTAHSLTSGVTLTNAFGFSGDQFAMLMNGGTVEIWSRLNGQWVHHQTLTHPAGGTTAFGAGGGLALSDDAMVIGQPHENYPDILGVAYVFRKVSAQWIYERRLQSFPDESNRFGESVAVTPNAFLIGGRSNLIHTFETDTPPDCDGDGVSDACEIAAGASDCNLNNVPDDCDIVVGSARDCNANGIVDDPCELHDTYQTDVEQEMTIWGLDGMSDLIWLNSFRVRPGGGVITHIDIAWRVPLSESYVTDGTPVTLMIYDDPNNDGRPSDAALLQRVQSVVRLPRHGETWRFDRVAMTPVHVGEVTDGFFVGAMIRGNGSPQTYFRAAGMSSGAEATSFVSAGPVGTVDVADMSIFQQDSTFTSTFSLRAISSDCDLNGQLNLCEIDLGAQPDIDANRMPDSCAPVQCNALEAPTVSTVEGERLGATLQTTRQWAFVGSPGPSGAGMKSNPVRCFQFNGAEWTQDGEIIASDTVSRSRFGRSISVRDHLAAIGADSSDGSGQGCAYVFKRGSGLWSQTAVLLPPGLAAGDDFGASCAIADGSIFTIPEILVGAPGDDETGLNAGAVQVFRRQGSAWPHMQQLAPPSGSVGARFGESVSAFNSSFAFVGAPSDDLYGMDAGSVLVYAHNSNWQFRQRLDPDDLAPGARYGCASKADRHLPRVVVGARGDDGAMPGSGSAYVHELQNNLWVQVAKLAAPDGAAGDLFGASLDIAGDRIVVGAPGHAGVGAAYVFERVNGTWAFAQKIMRSDGQAGDQFGHAVGLTLDQAVIGAPGADDLAMDGGLVRFNRHTAFDCNCNGIADFCDIDSGSSQDADGDGVPDECGTSPCPADIDGSGSVNVDDLLAVINAWGACLNPKDCPADVAPADGDGLVNVDDLLAVINGWGDCR